MKSIEVVNPVSNEKHLVTFSTRVASSGKVVIRLDGRAVGKINRASKIVFCDRKEVFDAVSKNVDSILAEND